MKKNERKSVIRELADFCLVPFSVEEKKPLAQELTDFCLVPFSGTKKTDISGVSSK